MWSDNESEVDLLGFVVHTQLLTRVVTDARLLPVAVGVFGDWGGGKSSVLRQLQRDLDAMDGVACLSFNGWVFEGYDDAKAALISAILVQLGEHQRFGPKVRSKVVSLLKRVDYLRLARALGHFVRPAMVGAATTLAASIDAHHGTALTPTVAPLLAGMATAGTGSEATPAAANMDSGGERTAAQTSEHAAVDWQGLIAQDTSPAGPLDIRTFRDEFARLIEETNLRALVVVVDDLDRCSPERLVENLEAIKLFLAVPRTAFVIAADERIVRHAIRQRYATYSPHTGGSAADESYDLVTDYMEKVIQIPYHLPRLSPSEVETYMTLLFCQLHVTPSERFADVLSACDAARAENLYRTFGLADVRNALPPNSVPDVLEQALQWTTGIAPALTAGLKGNPRQVKRLLNALLLRRQLADVAGLRLRDDVLVKLMLLEYLDPRLFDELYGWQAAANGFPPQLATLEQQARGEPPVDAVPETSASAARGKGGREATASIAGAGRRTRVEDLTDRLQGTSPRWQEPAFRDWLVLEPALADVDLRDYFWVARDRLHDAIGRMSMVPPYVRKLLEGLLSDAAPVRRGTAEEAHQKLAPDESATLLNLLGDQLRRHPDDYRPVDGLSALADAGLSGAVRTLRGALESAASSALKPAVAYTLGRLVQTHPDEAAALRELLRRWDEQHADTPVGAAAHSVLGSLDGTGTRPTRAGRSG